jgi:hypothetical protein
MFQQIVEGTGAVVMVAGEVEVVDDEAVEMLRGHQAIPAPPLHNGGRKQTRAREQIIIVVISGPRKWLGEGCEDVLGQDSLHYVGVSQLNHSFQCIRHLLVGGKRRTTNICSAILACQTTTDSFSIASAFRCSGDIQY